MTTPTHQPVTYAIREDLFECVLTSVESGLEYAKMCLSEHDNALGRTTLKNRVWAEKMEADIIHLSDTRDWLKSRKK